MNGRFRTKKIDSDKIIAIILVAFLLFVIVLTATLAYFSRNNVIEGQITLGEIDFSLFGNQMQVENIVPGDRFPSQVKLVNARDESGHDTNGLGSILVKYKLRDSSNESVIEPVFPTSNFWISDGVTYYYNYPVAPGQTIRLCDELKFSENAGNQYQNSEIEVFFDVDAIQAENEAYKELWADAPFEWKQKIEHNLT